MIRLSILTLLLAAPLVQAKPLPDFETVLTLQGRWGQQVTYELKSSHDRITINGETLDRSQWLGSAPYIGLLTSVEPGVAFRCASGSYQHSVKKLGKTYSESGCLSEKRLVNLTRAFKKLWKDALASQ